MNHFGEHLMIDGYGGDFTKLNDRERILTCLRGLPEQLGMRLLAKPVVYEAQDNGKKDPGGWSGFVVIAESHISIHTFPARGFVSIDIYTCKNGLDTRFTQKFFTEQFGLKAVETNFVERGKRYSENVAVSL